MKPLGHSPQQLLRPAAGLLLLAAVGAGARAQSATVVAQARLAASPLALVLADGGTWVERDGLATPLVLPAGVRLETIEATEDGWIAAGRRSIEQGTDVYLLASTPGEPAALPGLPEGRFRHRVDPALLVADGRLAGIAWLEGDSSLSFQVSAAPWTGSEWGPVEVVSPPGPAEQLALDGVALDDGSWLLVWAAVDGSDDEILWSRRSNGRWSPPERVHEDNRAPDIMPAVVSVPGGALVAWSWLDGWDYRLRTASWNGRRWSLQPAFGHKGALVPAWQRAGRGAFLLYGTVEPSTWSVLETSPAGRGVASAELRPTRAGRPLLEIGGQGQPGLRWLAPGRGEPPVGVTLDWQFDR